MLKLFSGTANPDLTASVAHRLGIPVSKSEVARFANSEVRVRILEDVKNQTCVVIQPTSNPADTNLMELFFFCDALKRQEAKKVIGIIPYFGYARQNIQHRVGECLSANVVVRFLETIGFDKIYTVDLHDEATEGIFSIPYKNLSALPLLAQKIRNHLDNGRAKMVKVTIVSPDQGGIERARQFAYDFFSAGTNFDSPVSIAVIEKKRHLDKLHQSEAVDLYGDVAGKVSILVDDIITSGGTLINAAKLCLKHGAKKILAVVVHHDFSPTPSNSLKTLTSLNTPIEKIFTTNTIALKENQKFKKLEEISLAPLIADELKTL